MSDTRQTNYCKLLEVLIKDLLILCTWWLLEEHAVCVDRFYKRPLSNLPTANSHMASDGGKQAGHNRQLIFWFPKCYVGLPMNYWLYRWLHHTAATLILPPHYLNSQKLV